MQCGNTNDGVDVLSTSPVQLLTRSDEWHNHKLYFRVYVDEADAGNIAVCQGSPRCLTYTLACYWRHRPTAPPPRIATLIPSHLALAAGRFGRLGVCGPTSIQAVPHRGADGELAISVALQPVDEHGAHRRGRRQDAALYAPGLLAVAQLHRF